MAAIDSFYRSLAADRPEVLQRPGRPCVYDHDDVVLLVKTVTEPPPEGATRWTMEALAKAMADHGVPISASQVWRICRPLT